MTERAGSATRERVLVMEQPDGECEPIATILAPDFNVVAVDGIREACGVVGEQEFDVVVAHGELDNAGALRVLRDSQHSQPLTSRILVTRRRDIERLRLNRTLVYACLARPIDATMLVTTVHNAARACRTERERLQLITDLGIANAQIARDRARLVALNQELETLVAIATHDLREPLKTSQFFLQSALERIEDTTAVDHLGRVIAAHERMDHLIVGLREWLTLQVDDLRLEPIALQAVVAEALASLEATLEERSAQIEQPKRWPRVRGNAALVRSVFENLLSNAMRFSPDGPPEVSLGWSVEGKVVRCWVSDRGIGIAPAYHAAIFGMFKRLESRRHFEGTGAGLAICKKIIERHGGRLGVKSERGQGATFWFTLARA